MRDRAAVFVVFGINGVALGSWATRTPALSERVDAEPGLLGLALLGASIGMLIAASLSGRLIERYGARAVVAGSAIIACASLPMIGFSTSVPMLAAALFVLGVSNGSFDVAMNVAGVEVERRLGRAIMPSLHAGFSFGALVGSAGAGFAASHGWSPGKHLTVAALAALVMLASVIAAVPGARPERAGPVAKPKTAPVRRPVLWLLAAIALFSAIAEGASSDWSALLMTSLHGVGEGPAAFAYAGFALAMALARLGGGWTQQRFGATRTLAVGAGVAAAGLVATTIPVAAFGFVGFALAGAGLAAAFPIALSLAGDAGKRSDGSGGERELAFATTIAYTGFLLGPPLIGWIAQVTSLAVSFLVVGLTAALIVPSALAAARAGKREKAKEAQPAAR